MMMKKITIYLSAAVIYLASSCSEEFLAENPVGTFFPEGSLVTQQDAQAAVDGVYVSMGRRNGFMDHNGVRYIAFGSSHQVEGSWPLRDWTFTASEGAFISIWSTLYAGINNANWAMKAIAEVPEGTFFDEYMGADGQTRTLRERYIAEARFMRAVAYWYLVNAWGNVPLPTEPFLDGEQDFLVKQGDMNAGFQLIIEDLEACSQILPNKTNYPTEDSHRPSSGAAKAMLAKTYLYLGDYTKYQVPNRPVSLGSADELYDKAMQLAEEVIQSGEFSLYNDFRMTTSTLTEYGEEYMFAFPHQEDANGNFDQIGARTTPPENPVGTQSPSWRGNRHVQHALVRSMPFDYRRWIGIYYAPRSRRGYYPTKYWDMRDLVSQNLTSNDFTIIRYAEVLLIYADAANERNNGPTAQAAEYLSQIRQRGARFFGNASPDGRTAYEQNWGGFGTEFTPQDTLLFAESDDRANNNQTPIAVDYSTVDLTRGVPRPVNGGRTTRPEVAYDTLYYTNATDLGALPYEQFSEEVWNEYDFEFLYEGTRTFDFFRKGRLADMEALNRYVNEEVIRDRNYLYPIPSQELVANSNLVQNPGW